MGKGRLSSDERCCLFVVGGILAFICVLLMVVLLPLSFKRVSFDEVAITYDKVSRKLGTEPLGEGRHNVGPSGSLIVFKTTQRTSEISRLEALTSDGITVELDVSVAYTVLTNEVRDVVDEFTDQKQHDEYLAQISAAVIRNTAVQFDARQFFLQREDFQNALQTSTEAAFTANNVHATVQIVQVQNIELPRSVEQALEDTTVAEQDVLNAFTERAQQVQAADIKLNLTRQEADLTLLQAERDVDKIEQDSAQAVLAERNRILQRTYAFGNISNGLGLGGNFFVDNYLKALVLQQNAVAKDNNSAGKTFIGI